MSSFARFAAKCLIQTVNDQNGYPVAVRASCKFRDSAGIVHHLEGEVPLAPIMRQLTTSNNMDVSGLGSAWKKLSIKASLAPFTIAKSIAKSKAVKDIHKAAKTVHRVTTKISPSHRIYNAVTQARKGNPSAVKQVQETRYAAEQGDPQATESLTTMQNMAAMMREKEAQAGLPPPDPVAVEVPYEDEPYAEEYIPEEYEYAEAE